MISAHSREDERSAVRAVEHLHRDHGAGIHILRHTFCSRLAMAGATPVAISTMAGHQSLSTTQRYLHLSPAAMDQAIALLDAGADLKASPEDDASGETVETRVGTKGA